MMSQTINRNPTLCLRRANRPLLALALALGSILAFHASITNAFSPITQLRSNMIESKLPNQQQHQKSQLEMSSIASNEKKSLSDRSITPAITTTNPYITETTQETNQYLKNEKSRWMELPASSLLLQKQQRQQLDVLERTIGRIAMAGAIGIIIRECYFGQSIVEQVMNIM